MEYKIVESYNKSLYSMEYKVKELIDEGWRPIGGLSVIISRQESEGYHECKYYQAMIKEDVNEQTSVSNTLSEDAERYLENLRIISAKLNDT